jgi:glycosyltransferase involved in cell wall biosynthesis
VSIVLPTYNGSRYLRESVDSCLAQSFENFELIIVDDGSTDNTWDIIQDFVSRDSRVTGICHKTNKNLPSALNTGFENANGDLYTWTSDDNLFLPEAIGSMVGFLDANTNVDIVYANYAEINEFGIIFATRNKGPWYELPIECNIGACFMYRKRVDKMVGGYAFDSFCVEDYDFWLKAYRAGIKFGKLDEQLYLYRNNPDSLTSKKSELIIKETIRLMLDNLDKSNRIHDNIRMRAYLKCVRHAKTLGDKLLAILCMKKAKQINLAATEWTCQELIDYASE